MTNRPNQLTRKQETAISKAFLFLVKHPFSTVKDFRRYGNVTKNGNDAKTYLQKLVDSGTIVKVNVWSEERYCTNLFEEPNDITILNLWRMKDVVFDIIESDKNLSEMQSVKDVMTNLNTKSLTKIPQIAFKKKVKYTFGIHFREDLINQILGKYLNLFCLKMKILLSDKGLYEKNQDDFEAKRRYERRREELIQFLSKFKTFLEDYQKLKKGSRDKLRQYVVEAKQLDKSYELNLLHYNNVKHGRKWPITERLAVYTRKILESKKDASEILGISMKEVGNILEILEDGFDKPDFIRIDTLAKIEYGNEYALVELPHVTWLSHAFEFREALIESKGRKRKEIKRDALHFFPNMIIET